MEINNTYASRLFFPTSAFPQVYFEAVANAFDAGASEISIVIATDGAISPDHLEITVRDNGVGFTPERFDRFRSLQEPQDQDHKGLGRLVYLQYFKSVSVQSTYADSRRSFVFADKFGGESTVVSKGDGESNETTLRFSGFVKERLRSYDDLKPSHVKLEILGHFLPLLYARVRAGDDFKITIALETAKPNRQHDFFSETVVLTAGDVPTFQMRTITSPEFGAFGDVTMAYFVREEGAANTVLTAVSVDQRTVPLPLLASRSVPPGISAVFLFESDLFQGRSDSARQRLVLPDFLSEAALHRILRQEVAAVLSEHVPQIADRNEKTLQHFEKHYPHLVGLFDTETVGIVDREEALETAQWRFFRKQKEVLEGGALDDEAFMTSLELSSRTLTEYVLYRELIIQKLAGLSASHAEEHFHNLIVPRYNIFDGGELKDGIYRNNAWILDDKFMSFRTILSEARMDAVIDAIRVEGDPISDPGRPDISMVFSADPANSSAVDVVVVEVKRRVADDKEGPYAVTQLLKRARKFVEHCPNIQRMWYFGIIEIDAALDRLLRDEGWTPLYSKGRVFYRDHRLEREADSSFVLAPICLMSYDAVMNDAAARNHTFLEILKSDIRQKAAEAARS